MSKKKTPNEKVELKKIISKFNTTLENTLKEITKLEEFKEEKLSEFVLLIEDKQKELDELTEKYEKELKDGQIKTDQQLAEYKREGAVKILEETNEVPVDADELEELNDNITRMSEEHAQELEDVIKSTKADAAKEKAIALRTLELEHKATIATIQAENKQLSTEIATLNGMIERMREDIVCQRELTRQVAESGSKAQIVQNLGK